MNFDSYETEKFYMVANAKSRVAIPVPFLVYPPRAVQTSEKEAESEAVRLAQQTGEVFIVLEAKAYVEVVDGKPTWTEMDS